MRQVVVKRRDGSVTSSRLRGVARSAASAAAIAGVLASAAGPAVAAPVDWDVTPANGTIEGGSGAWDLAAVNWTTDGGSTNVAWPNLTTDVARFGGTSGTVTVGAAVQANGLTFDSTGYTVTGNTITLAGTTPTITVTNAADTATVASVLAGTAGLTKEGAGKVIINGANTFTGNITLNGGTLETNMAGGTAASPLGNQIGTATYRQLTFNNNATLRTTATWNDNTPSATNVGIVFNFAGAGTLDVSTGTLTIDDGAGAGTGSANSQLQGGGTLTKSGVGTLSLGNGSSDFASFTGAIVVAAGTLNVGTGANQLGTAAAGTTVQSGAVLNVNAITVAEPLTISGTGLASAPAGALIGSGGTVSGTVALAADASVGGAGNLTISGVVSGGFNLTKVGAGAVILNGTNTYAGSTTVSAGAVRAMFGVGLPNTTNVTLNGGAYEPTANFAGTLGTAAGQVQLPAGTSGFSGGLAAGITVNLNGGATLQWGVTPGFSPASLLLGQSTAAGTVTLLNPIDLNGGVRSFSGNGPNNLPGIATGAITSTGGATGIVVNGPAGGAGVVQLTNAANVGINSVTLTGGELGISVDGNIGGATTPIIFNGGGLQVLGTGLSNFGSHPVTFTAAKNIQLDVNSAAHTFNFDATAPLLVAGQTLTKVGAGTLKLAAAATNTVTTLNMNGGTLDLNGGTLALTNLGGTTLRGTANSSVNNGTLVLSTAGGVNYADNSVSAGVTLTINAKVSGADNTTGFEYCCDNPGGTIVLTNPANDFQGNVFVNSAGTISVPAIGMAGVAGPLGRGNTITLAGLSGTVGGRLLYTGPGETTDRVIALGQTQNILDASGGSAATPLKFTSNISVTNTAAKTFTLQGTGFGELAGTIPNNTAATTVTKMGTGTWTLSGAGTYTGNTNINGGTLVFANGASNSTTARMFLGVGGTSGAVVQQAGSTISVAPTTGSTDVLGLGQGGGYGYYLNNGGSLTVGQLAMGGATAGTNNTGVFEQNGGTTTVSAATGYLITGWTGTNANGILNIFAGTVNGNTPGQDIQMGFGASLNSFGMFNVLGPTAVFNATGAGTTRIVDLAKQTGNFAGVLNLNGGTTTANAIRAANTTTPTFLGFNGGTLKANVATTTFVNNLTAATIYAGGATIDTNALAVTVPQNLLAPTASGLTSIPVATGGAGYIGPPAVRVTGGGGTGATAIAVVDLVVGSPTYGRVTGFTITSAGSGYTSAPTVTLIGGGATTAATPGTATTGVTPTTGGLTKVGAGTLTLSGANTYAGPTVVTAGTLALSRASTNNIPNSSTIVVGDSVANAAAQLSVTGLTGGILALSPGQTVGGHGSVVGALTIGRGSAVAPGTGIGTLSITGTLSTVATGTGADPTYAAELAGGASTSSDRLQLTGTGASGVLDLANPDVLNLLPQAAVGSTPVIYTIATFAGLGATGVQTFDSVLVNGAVTQSANPGGANYVLVAYTPGDGTTAGSGNIQVTVANVAAVPEPAAASLLGLAALGLLARRRRR